MKSKKIFAIGAVALSLLLASCSSSSDKAAEDTAAEAPAETAAPFPTEAITLNISWWGEQEAPGAQKWLEESMALYSKEHPNVTLKHVLQTTDGLIPSFEAAAAAQSGPDIQYFWGGIYSQQPGWDGNIAPISDYLSADELSHYINAEMEEGFQGKIWTAPWYVKIFSPQTVLKFQLLGMT
jgi:raffinose/stachyose/melibiose transport system substrate-binding protein